VLVRQDSVNLSGFSLENLQRFQNKTTNLLLENFFGFTVDVGEPIQAAIVYQEPDTVYRFPIAYQSSWLSTIDWVLDLSLTGQNLSYKSHQIRTSTVDAWGTIITPFDTFTNVVRLRSEIEHQDTIISDTLVLPLNIIQVEYTWFDTLYKLPVMIANGIANDTLEIISTLEYIYEATCPAPTWTAVTQTNVFYIDSSGSALVDFELINSNAGIYNWNFDDGTSLSSPGNVSHAFSLGGSYTVTVEGCMTDCLPLESCTSQTLEIEVIDTLFTAVQDPEQLWEITIYPNPARDHLYLVAGQGPIAYRIYDMLGQPSSWGIFEDGQTEISLSSLKPGIYLIAFWKPGSSKRTVRKLTILP
jgi:hypothetical protein